MLQEQEIKKLIKSEISSSQREEPGVVYLVLEEIFPLQRIKNKIQHKIALEIVEKVSLFLKRENLSRDHKKQIFLYLDTLGILIEDFEEENFLLNFKKISGPDVLKYLMEEHQLKQTDLQRELGGQSVVSSVLQGKRRLNTRQINALAKRFGVSPAVFF